LSRPPSATQMGPPNNHSLRLPKTPGALRPASAPSTSADVHPLPELVMGFRGHGVTPRQVTPRLGGFPAEPAASSNKRLFRRPDSRIFGPVGCRSKPRTIGPPTPPAREAHVQPTSRSVPPSPTSEVTSARPRLCGKAARPSRFSAQPQPLQRFGPRPHEPRAERVPRFPGPFKPQAHAPGPLICSKASRGIGESSIDHSIIRGTTSRQKLSAWCAAPPGQGVQSPHHSFVRRNKSRPCLLRGSDPLFPREARLKPRHNPSKRFASKSSRHAWAYLSYDGLLRSCDATDIPIYCNGVLHGQLPHPMGLRG